MQGTAKFVSKTVSGKVNKAEKCADACYAKSKCLVWEYDAKKKRCKLEYFQGSRFAFYPCFTFIQNLF